MKHGNIQSLPNPNRPPLSKWQGASSISIVLLLEFSVLSVASPSQLCHQWQKLQITSTECFVIVVHLGFPPVP